jgi:1-acyl-sn-glycerol-3-phosphate acyltransferase
VFFRLVRFIVYLPLRAAFRVRFMHRERLPRPPYILSGNHVSLLDPIVLALLSSTPVGYMGKDELFRGRRWFARFLTMLGAFPVKRGTPDREALAEACRRLEAGRVVGIFPEGTRARGDLGAAYGGAAFVALRTGAPIIPVGIAGTERALPRRAKRIRFARVTIALGEPVRPDEAPQGSRREKVDALTATLMERIADAVHVAGGEDA